MLVNTRGPKVLGTGTPRLALRQVRNGGKGKAARLRKANHLAASPRRGHVHFLPAR